MELVTMVFKNADGETIEKEVETRLVSTYLAIGWKIKEKKVEKREKFYDQPKKIEK